MTIKTPPVDWDRHAQVVARSIASLDRSRLRGSTTQFTAIVHEAIVDAMMMAAEDRAAETVASVPEKVKSAFADIEDIRSAIAEFRRQRRDTYPHEVVVMLIGALEQLANVAEAGLREIATCAKTQTGEVAPC